MSNEYMVGNLASSEAATIAISGAVTFGVELNPFVASALAIVQEAKF